MWLAISFLVVVSIILLILQKPERKYSAIGIYYRKIRIELSAVKYRRDVFSQVTCGDVITIKLDLSKEYSGNAIGAYTQSGKLLGYIPRHQRKLINKFRDNSESLATIHKKFQKGAHFSILIDVLLPMNGSHLHTRDRVLQH
ncbi:MAG: hypothetical protein H7Y31_01125 [Chitinophagaceae bacterium]|nr:hypothetical protein [Chitinophagaceae bacterium]